MMILNNIQELMVSKSFIRRRIWRAKVQNATARLFSYLYNVSTCDMWCINYFIYWFFKYQGLIKMTACVCVAWVLLVNSTPGKSSRTVRKKYARARISTSYDREISYETQLTTRSTENERANSFTNNSSVGRVRNHSWPSDRSGDTPQQPWEYCHSDSHFVVWWAFD